MYQCSLCHKVFTLSVPSKSLKKKFDNIMIYCPFCNSDKTYEISVYHTHNKAIVTKPVSSKTIIDSCLWTGKKIYKVYTYVNGDHVFIDNKKTPVDDVKGFINPVMKPKHAINDYLDKRK